MKVEKTYDLLNSEGSIIKIQRIGGYWHYQFHGTKMHHITTIREILGAIVQGKGIVDKTQGRIFFLSDYPLSMKGGDPSYYERIIKDLVNEEMERCKTDLEYFKVNYL